MEVQLSYGRSDPDALVGVFGRMRSSKELGPRPFDWQLAMMVLVVMGVI